MITESLEWTPESGWSRPFPALDGDGTLVLVFGASKLIDSPAVFDELRAAYPRAVLAGCSSAGEILGDQVADDSLAVAVTRFDQTRLRTVGTEISHGAESQAAGRRLAAELQADDLKYVLVLSDGLHVNGTELVHGLNDVFGPRVVVTGGLAGDGPRFERTWVLHAGRPTSQWISAVGFYGKTLRIGHGSKGGWDIFGPDRLITRSKGNILYELDGVPALSLYKEYLGERAAGLPATGLLFPLAIRATASDPRQLVRTILQVDETEQALVFAGDMPEGWRAQLMRANFDRLVDGASEAALSTARDADHPALAIAISCVGRRLVLGERTEEEVEATLEFLPAGTVQVGFYSYGELSPTGVGPCDLHNQTMTLTALWEDPESVAVNQDP